MAFCHLENVQQSPLHDENREFLSVWRLFQASLEGNGWAAEVCHGTLAETIQSLANTVQEKTGFGRGLQTGFTQCTILNMQPTYSLKQIKELIRSEP
jgi:hypothetical protein